jgi:hypothetical protein
MDGTGGDCYSAEDVDEILDGEPLTTLDKLELSFLAPRSDTDDTQQHEG